MNFAIGTNVINRENSFWNKSFTILPIFSSCEKKEINVRYDTHNSLIKVIYFLLFHVSAVEP